MDWKNAKGYTLAVCTDLNLARQDEEKLKKVIACAVREAYRTLKVHGGTFTKKERERREGGSAL